MNKKFWMLGLALLFSWQFTLAQDEAPATTAPQPTNPIYPSPADLSKFEEWLKNNVPPTQLQTADNDNKQPPVTKKSPETIVFKGNSNLDSPIADTKPLTFQQSRDAMVNSAPPSLPPSADSNAAFNAMVQQNMPLSPQQVIQLRQSIDTSQRAASIPANVPPKPVSSTIMVNLAPGATPPAIRLAQGYVSSLVFVDSTGSPWPVVAYDIGDPKSATIQWDGKSNVILIQAASPYGDSNFVVRLAGLTTPITLQLVSGQRVVDYRADIHVSGVGPNAKDVPTGTGLPASANQLLLNVLDGIAPPGGKQLMVKGGDCLAWVLGDKMYLRTRLTLLSPGWTGRMVSPDGMNAYEVPKSSTVLVSQYGEPVEFKIEGF